MSVRIDFCYSQGDEKGRLTALDKGERQSSFAYTDKGFLASVTDPESRTTIYDHDAMGRVTAVHRPDGEGLQVWWDRPLKRKT